VSRWVDVIGISYSLFSHLSLSKQYNDCLKGILGVAYKTNRIVGKRTLVTFNEIIDLNRDKKKETDESLYISI